MQHPPFNKNGSSRKKTIRLVILGLIAVGLLALNLWKFSPKIFGSKTVAEPPQTEIPVSASVEMPEKQAEAPAVSAEAPGSQTPGQYLNVPAGNMAVMTKLLAEDREASLRLQLEKKNSELNTLLSGRTTISSPLPPVVFPGPVAQAPAEKASSPETPVSADPQLVAVQGFGGKMSATFSTPSGLKTLKVGDSLGLGRIESISVDGVNIRNGESTIFIPVEE